MKIAKITTKNENGRKPRIYFFHDGENILENLINRYGRQSTAYRSFFPEVVNQLKLTGEIDAIWSQNTGCSCGCSPGFIIQNADKIGLTSDIFVDIVSDPIVFGGLTQEQLKGFFDSVADPVDWKAPIDKVVSSENLANIIKAVQYFTGTAPTISYHDAENWRIESIGYRQGPCGDH